MTLLSNHHFPRHSHDQFAIGVMAFGGHRSWSDIGTVQSSAGDVITANPGEMHDGIPLEGNPRGWRMMYFDLGLHPNTLRSRMQKLGIKKLSSAASAP